MQAMKRTSYFFLYFKLPSPDARSSQLTASGFFSGGHEKVQTLQVLMMKVLLTSHLTNSNYFVQVCCQCHVCLR